MASANTGRQPSPAPGSQCIPMEGCLKMLRQGGQGDRKHCVNPVPLRILGTTHTRNPTQGEFQIQTVEGLEDIGGSLGPYVLGPESSRSRRHKRKAERGDTRLQPQHLGARNSGPPGASGQPDWSHQRALGSVRGLVSKTKVE